MTTLVLEGGHLITPVEERFADLVIADGKIVSLGKSAPPGGQRLDVRGSYVTPGLFDLQVNGSPSCNLWGDPTVAQLESLRKSLVEAGTTSFLPTLITD